MHCYHHDVDVNETEYTPHVYSECYNTFIFPLSIVKMLLNNVKNIIPETNTMVKNEVDSMIDSLPDFQKIYKKTIYLIDYVLIYNSMRLN